MIVLWLPLAAMTGLAVTLLVLIVVAILTGAMLTYWTEFLDTDR